MEEITQAATDDQGEAAPVKEPTHKVQEVIVNRPNLDWNSEDNRNRGHIIRKVSPRRFSPVDKQDDEGNTTTLRPVAVIVYTKRRQWKKAVGLKGRQWVKFRKYTQRKAKAVAAAAKAANV